MSETIELTLPASDWKRLVLQAKERGEDVLDKFVARVTECLKGGGKHVAVHGQLESFKEVVRLLKKHRVRAAIIAPLETRLQQVENGYLPEDMENAKLALERMKQNPDWPGFDLEHVVVETAATERTLF
jgi:tRNA1(Val) A37 N6-methylase TrmN6